MQAHRRWHAPLALLTAVIFTACHPASPRLRSASTPRWAMPYAFGAPPPGPYRPTVLTPPPAPPPAPPPPVRGGQVRYRLALNGESENPGEALRCYSSCRQAETEDAYLECLRDCPGFEVTAGASCGPDDGLPRSVCVERRPTGPKREPDAGAVAAVILNVVLVFSLVSVCSASNVRCYGANPWYRWGY